MITHTHSPRWLLALLLLLNITPACSKPAERRAEAVEDTIIGRPPPARDDPFADATLPPDAKPAPASGYMGDENRARPQPMPDDQRAATVRAPKPEPKVIVKPAPKVIVKPAPIEPTPKPTPTPAVAVVTRPRDTTPTPTPATDAPHQCFSCVRVCAVADAANGCADSPEDMICGWGAAEDRASAQRMAQAQCDATLNMARDMPLWSSIEGSCPPASCR